MNQYLELVYHMFKTFNHNDTINISQFEYLLLEKSENDQQAAEHYHNLLRTFYTACTEKSKLGVFLGFDSIPQTPEQFLNQPFIA